jgi:hypothetical protein
LSSRADEPADTYTVEWHDGLPSEVLAALGEPARVGAPSAVLVLAVGTPDAVRTALLSTRELRAGANGVRVALASGSRTAATLRPKAPLTLVLTDVAGAFTVQMTVRDTIERQGFTVASCDVSRTRVERVGLQWNPLTYVPSTQVAQAERWLDLDSVLDDAGDGHDS